MKLVGELSGFVIDLIVDQGHLCTSQLVLRSEFRFRERAAATLENAEVIQSTGAAS